MCVCYRYDAACLLLVYGVYIVVLCFDVRISEYVLQRFSPCCMCLGKNEEELSERRPLSGWSHDQDHDDVTSLRVSHRSRTDSGIFHEDSSYSHLSLSLHGLSDTPHGTHKHTQPLRHAPWYTHIDTLLISN